MHHPHDHLFHQVFAAPEHAAGLLRAVLPPGLVDATDWDSLTECSGSLVDGQLDRRQTDLLFAARCRRRDCAILYLIEHKSAQEPFAVLQLLGYVHRIWEKWRRAHPDGPTLPQIVPLVLHHDHRPWRSPTTLTELLPADDADDPIQPTFTTLLLDLARYREDELAAFAVSPLARLVLLHLQVARWLSPAELDRALCRWAPWFRAAAATPGGLAPLQVFHTYILSVTDMPHQLLGDRMAELLGPEAGATVMSTADKLIAEGMTRGLQQGKLEGKLEGKAEGKAEQLLLQLDKRFGRAAEQVTARVRSAASSDLDRWALRLLDAATIDDVFDG